MPDLINLLFYYSDEFDESMVREMRELVHRLRDSHTWRCGPPRFIDECVEAEVAADEDTRTVGGILPLTAISHHQEPNWEIERTHFAEVSRIVVALQSLTAALKTEVELQLGDHYVGDIRDGVVGRTLQAGLLDAWAARLS